MTKRSPFSGAGLLDKLLAVYHWGWHRLLRTLGRRRTPRRRVRLAVEGLEARYVPTTHNVLSFAPAIYTTTDAAGSATITVERVYDSLGGTDSVDYATSDGTATAGTDYTTTSGTATFPVGVDTVTFNVPILGDTAPDGSETVHLTLSNPSANADIGVGSATLTIRDSDAPPLTVTDHYNILHDHTLLVPAATGVLANDSDPGHDPLTASLVSGYGPSHGTVTAVSSTGFFTYVPDSGYSGPDSFIYAANDGSNSANAAVIVDVLDQAPVVPDCLYSVAQDGSLTVAATTGLLQNASDPDGDPLTVSLVSGPGHGSASVAGDGSFTYTPTSGYAGPDNLIVAISDGALTTNAAVSFDVTSGTAVAFDDAYAVLHDNSLTVSAAAGVLHNDLGSGLTATLISGPSTGSLTSFNSDGSYVYAAASGAVGPATFVYEATDGTNTSEATVTVDVTDQPPTVLDHIYTVAKNTSVSITAAAGLLFGAGDADGDALTAAVVSYPSQGTLTPGAGGAFTYAPDTDYVGPDTFVFSASDGASSRNGVVVLVVEDRTPAANDDAYSTPHDTTLTVSATDGLRANDNDPAGGTLTVTAVNGSGAVGSGVTLASGAQPTLASNGSFSYVPTSAWTGTDSFQYTISNGTETATAHVTIYVTNGAPVAVDDTASSTNENTALTIAASTLLGNDHDPDSDPLTLTDYSQPANGTLAFVGNSFTYTPNTNYSGSDSFTYTINDGMGASATATVALTVTHVNQRPVAHNQSADTPPDTAVSVPVLHDATDPDGDTLTVSAKTNGSHGTVSIDSGSLSVTYTPDSSYVGVDSFSYTASDGHSGTDTKTVTVDVGNGQWANSVIAASSQWTDSGPYYWYAVQALGVPNTLDDNDIETAWAPEPENGTVETLTLGFPTADYANGVLIRETDGNGFVTQVELLDSSDAYHTVWSGTDATAAGSPGTFFLTFTDTTYLVQGVRITVDTAHDPNNWEEIDAVRLYDATANDPTPSAPTLSSNPYAASVDEDGSVNINISSLASGSSGDPLLVAITGDPTNGTATVDDNGTPNDLSDDFLTYTVDPLTRGTDSFTYTVTDIYGNSASGTVNVTINPVNHPPDAEDTFAVADQDTALTISPLVNDSDPDNDALTILSPVTPAHGSVGYVDGTDTQLTYTPDSGFSGSDIFSYSISDGHGGTATANITVVVYPTGQWASAVLDVTSQYDPGDGSADWGALQTLGVPDTFAYGDAATAWAAANADDGTGAAPEQLTVGFTTPAAATGVLVRETNGNGFITAVELLESDGTAHTIWTGTDPSQAIAPTDFTLTFPATAYDVAAVRLSVDSNFTADDWEEIDAVRLLTGGSPSSVTVTAVTVNHAPTASAAWAVTDVGAGVTVPLLSYASDPDGTTPTLSVTSGPSDGTYTISGGTFLYTPNSGYSGSDSLTYEVTDSAGATATATLHLTVADGQWATSVVGYSSEADDGPYGTAAYALGRSDTTTYGDTSASWTPDPNSTATTQTLTLGLASAAHADGFVIREASGNGFVTLVELRDTSGTYHTVWSGTDSTAAGNVTDFVVNFSATSYQVNALRITVHAATGDGNPVGIDAVKVLTSSAPPTAPTGPTAADDSVTVAENMPVNIAVLSNDTLTSGSKVELQVTGPPSNGTATVDLHGLVNDASQAFVKYQPNTDFSGSDTFTYMLTDRYGHTSTATVTITVSAVNQPPVAGYTAAYTEGTTAVTLNVLANASDPDGDTLTVPTASAGAHGTVTVHTDYTITYTPASGFTGSDTFTYRVDDGHGHVDVGHATVIVYGAGQWASTIVATSSSRDTADAALGAPDDKTWTPDGTTALDFLTVGFATPAYGHGVLVREEGGAGAVTKVDLLESNGTAHTIWSGTDPTASTDGTPVDFVLTFATTSYQVAAVRVFVSGGGTLDAVELLTSGTASSTTVSGRGFDDSGAYTVSTYNSSGQATSSATYVAGSLVQSVANTYDTGDGHLTASQVTDANDHVTDTTFDVGGHVLTQTLAYGTAGAATTTNTYDDRGDLLSVTDPDGNETVYTYDEGSRELTETDPLGNVATRTYDDLGRLATVTNRNGQEVFYSYDSEGRESSETYAADELQAITLPPTAVGGTWTLTFGSDTTAALAYNASAAAVQAALEALPGIGSGNVAVSGSAAAGFTVLFQGALADTNVSQLTADGTSLLLAAQVTVAEVTPGVAGVQEVQTLTLPAGAVKGTWEPTSGASAVSWDASDAEIMASLDSVVGTVTVTGGGGDYTVIWNADGPQGLLEPVSVDLSTQPTISVAETAHGDSSTQEVQTITVGGSPDGGSWSLNGGSALAYDVTVSDVQARLDATLGSGVVTVTGTTGGPYTVTWTAYGPQMLLGVDGSGLTHALGNPTAGETTAGVTPVQEVQTLTLPAATFKGTWQPTSGAAAVEWGADFGTIASALDSALGVSVSVSGSFGGFTVTWDDAGPQSLLTPATVSLSSETNASVTETTAGDSSTQEVQTITLSGSPDGGSPDGGTWSLNGGSALAYDATVSDVQTNLDATLGSGVVTVTGTTGGPYTITWTAVGSQSVLTADGSELTHALGDPAATETTAGAAPVQEVQTLTLPAGAVKGTWEPTSGASAVSWDASDAEIMASLDSVVGTVTVTGGGGDYTVIWNADGPQGLLEPVSVDLSTQPTISVAETAHGDSSTQEVQTITVGGSPDGGSWSLNGGSALAYDVTVSDVQARLDATLGSGVVTVTGTTGGPYTVTWTAYGPQMLLGVDGSGLTHALGNPTAGETTAGVTPVQEVQTLILPSGVVGGTWAPAGTISLAWNVSASEVVYAIDSDLGVSVSVTGSYDTAFTVTWAVAGPQPALHPDASGLEQAGGWTSVRTEQEGAASGTLDTLAYTYNAQGLVATAGNDQGTYTYSYDDAGRVIGVSEPFGVSLTFGYDANGNRDLVQDSLGGEEDSLYNADNQLVTRILTQGSTVERLDFTYTAAGQLATIKRYSDPAGTALIATTTYSYDDQDNVTGIVTKDGSGTTLDEFDYVYDLSGNLTSETDNGTTTNYGYDGQNQLTSAGSSAYSYDANGNPDNTGDAVGTGNQLTTDGTWDYSYDLEGNETEKINIATGEAWTYSYDAQNHLTVAQDWTADPGLGGTLVEEVDYKYDIYGNRDEMDVISGGTTTVTRFALDGWNPAKTDPVGNEDWDVLADLNGSNALVTRYLRGDVVDQIFARVDKSGSTTTPYWLLTDHLGSVRTVLDGTGTAVDQIAYDAFGDITSESDAAYGGRYKWTGREFDVETGLQYNRARFYDPTTGRWISQDLMGFAAGDSNLYRYARNRPIQQTDPSGLWPPPPATQSIEGNLFGNWAVDQQNKNGTAKTNSEYSSTMTLRFIVNRKEVDAKTIAFVQIVRVLDAKGKNTQFHPSRVVRMVAGSWIVDSAPGFASGWYGYLNPAPGEKGLRAGPLVWPWRSAGELQDAKLLDVPRWDQPDTIWDFETFAIAKSGVDAGKVYGGLQWGFKVDKKLKIQSLPRVFLPDQTEEFILAWIAWDQQAASPLNSRNLNGVQLPLGPFFNNGQPKS